MMASQDYNCPTLFATSFRTFDDLRKIKKFCDTCLLVSDQKIYVHKVVLAADCPFFKNLFYGPFTESGKNEIELKEINHEILSLLIDYMYTGNITINSENVYAIYETADRFQIQFIKECCVKFLEGILNMDNCMKIWVLAGAYVSEKLQTAAKNCILSDLSFVSNKQDFLNLSEEQLSQILSFRSENQSADTFIDATINWVKFDEKNRKDFLRTFLKTIPSTFISSKYLNERLSTNELFQAELSYSNYLLEIYREKTKAFLEKQKLNTSVIIIPYSITTKESLYYYLLNNTCMTYGNICAPEVGYDGVTYKKALYIFGKESCYSSYGGDDDWKFQFHHTHGKYLRAVTFNESIYMIAGDTSPEAITKYDINAGKTDNFHLKTGRVCPGVTIIDGSIYVCGGKTSNSVERFDPREGISQHFGNIPNTDGGYNNATSLSNSIYCIQSKEMSKLDIRNSSQWEKNRIFSKNMFGPLCTSYGKVIFGDFAGNTIYEIDSNNLNRTKIETMSCLKTKICRIIAADD